MANTISAFGFPRRRALLACAAVLIGVGVFLRLCNADHKVLSDDEIVSIMHGLGLTEAGIRERAVGFHTVAELQDVIHPASNRGSIRLTIASLRLEDPQHPPVYYLAEYGWTKVFGTSLASFRLLPAITGVLALACMFWLCWELFGTTAAGWAGAALLALSPVNILYSQEIREYSLWLVTILVASALFVRALRNGSRSTWALYAVALAFSLYVHPASALLALAHAVVAVFANSSRANRVSAIVAIGAGCMLFLPWLLVLAHGAQQVHKVWAQIYQTKLPLLAIVKNAVHLVRVSILDLNGVARPLDVAAAIPILGLIGYAFATMKGGVSRLLAWSLLICTTLPIVLPDVLFSGRRTETVRYFIPMFVAIDLALAGLLLDRVINPPLRTSVRRFWLTVFVLVFSARFGSAALSSQAPTWWTKYNMRSRQVAEVVNRSTRPILISDHYVEWALALGEYLDPRTQIALNPHCYMCNSRGVEPVDLSSLARPGRTGTVFLLGPSQPLQRQVKAAIAGMEPGRFTYRCIDVRDNCRADLSLFEDSSWVAAGP